MRAREFIIEAAYDSMVLAMKRQFPDQEQYISKWVKWAKTALQKSDRVTWFLKILRADLAQALGTKELGTYQFTDLQQLANQIHHFYGFEYAPIQNYVYKDQPVSQVVADLTAFENAWKDEQEATRGVTPQKGDYKLFEFADGTAWWFVNRAYCPEEGRSGQHCGNATGMTKTKQRILSLRNDQNQVICTFILEHNGTLGEMKAKGNKKPDKKFHPQILNLLMWDRIKGIGSTAGQYNPGANFNVFDLNEEQLEYVDQNKPILITSQIKSNPISALTLPDSLKEKYRGAISKKNPVVGKLLFNSTDTDWSNAVKQDPTLIIYAPTTIDNWRELLVDTLARHENLLFRAPAYIGKNYELLKDIIEISPFRVGEINPNLKGYDRLCRLAVSKNGAAVGDIPKERVTPELYQLAIKSNGVALRFVPKGLRTPEMYQAAVESNGAAIQFVPDDFKTLELCRTAVKTSGSSLNFVPEEFRTPELYQEAVGAHGDALYFVPNELKTEELCWRAVKQTGVALMSVPTNLRTPEMCQAAVETSSVALASVPNELKTLKICVTAVRQNKNAYPFVPENLKDKVIEITGINP